jgi:hypothetical protein
MTMTSLDPSAGGTAGRSMRGRVPVFSPQLKGEEFDVVARNLEMIVTEGSHDAATISMISTSLTTTDGIVDSPISFYYGAPPRTELFQGYVASVTDEQQAASQLTFTLSVLGPSKVMFEGKPRFFTNRTATAVAGDLVNNAGLGAGGHSHTHLWGSLAQTDESDWTMITNLAKRIGWSVYPRYGVVQIIDPLKVFREVGPYCRLVSGQSNIGLGTTDRTLIDFSSQKMSEMVKDNLGIKFGYFTTGNEAQTITQSGDFAGFVFESTQLIRDQVEAQVFVDAWQTRADGWAESGVARIWGDADIWPGMCVEVVTAATKYFQPEGDGKWFVRAVGHNATDQQYQTVLFLTRPGKDPTPGFTETPHKPFWEQQDPPKGRPSLSLDTDKKRWISSWNDPRLRGLI